MTSFYDILRHPDLICITLAQGFSTFFDSRHIWMAKRKRIFANKLILQLGYIAMGIAALESKCN